MIVAGLTGGIGAGKSVVGELFVKAGYCLIDTDIIAREEVRKGSAGLAEIVLEFGQKVLDQQGNLDRSKLGEMVFADAKQRQKLELILHPKIRNKWEEKAGIERKNGGWRGVIVVIPLLYETGAETAFQKIICVSCSPATQMQRLSARGWSQENICQRIGAQWRMGLKVDKADIVIWNEYTLAVCAEQVAKARERLDRERSGG